MGDLVQLAIDADGVGILTFNRPEVRNALNRAAMHELADIIHQAEESETLRILLLTGEGKQAFISGGDVRDLHDHNTEEDGYRLHDLMASLMNRLSALHVPVIAAMEGATRGGGGEVALAADMRVAGNDATIAFSQVRMGVTPGWGGARRLYSLVGYRVAMNLLMTGRVVTMPEARILGLVDLTARPGGALDEARRMADQIINQPPLAIRGIKEVLQAYHTLPDDEARLRERAIFARLWGSRDHTEASAAFIEKREPQFTGE